MTTILDFDEDDDAARARRAISDYGATEAHRRRLSPVVYEIAADHDTGYIVICGAQASWVPEITADVADVARGATIIIPLGGRP